MNRIKEIRQRRSLTQRQLAEIIGTTQKRISYWETERHTPTLQYAIKIATALECSLEELTRKTA
jgi:putative transcriptional regulator